jgi:hypothetical protein
VDPSNPYLGAVQAGGPGRNVPGFFVKLIEELATILLLP